MACFNGEVPMANVHLVETVRAGKQTWAIIFGQQPRFMLGEKFVRAIALTDAEAALTLPEVVLLCQTHQLASQMPKDRPDAV